MLGALCTISVRFIISNITGDGRKCSVFLKWLCFDSLLIKILVKTVVNIVNKEVGKDPRLSGTLQFAL